jgi:mannuronan 5-epimerase
MSVPLRFLSLITPITIILFSSSYDGIKSTIDVDGSRGAEDCVDYIRSEKIIKVSCKFAILTEIYNELDDPDVLVEESPGVWILNANIQIDEGSTLLINSSDTSWLKINSTGGVAHYIEVRGNMFVDSVKITGWDTKSNASAKTSENGKMPRSYIRVVEGKDSSAEADITNSEIAYLGYKSSRSFGLSYYAGAESSIRNNKIHNLWYSFYSANYRFGVYNLTIENNHFYNNTLYGIDPHSGSHHLVIRNNTVNDNGKHGIICSKHCYNLLIEKNRVFNNFDRGIMLDKNITKSIIRNNTVAGNTVQIAIHTLSNNNEIYGNNIYGGEAGIEISDRSGNNTVHDNVIRGADYGIYLLEPGLLNKVISNDIRNTSESSMAHIE